MPKLTQRKESRERGRGKESRKRKEKGKGGANQCVNGEKDDRRRRGRSLRAS